MSDADGGLAAEVLKPGNCLRDGIWEITNMSFGTAGGRTRLEAG